MLLVALTVGLLSVWPVTAQNGTPPPMEIDSANREQLLVSVEATPRTPGAEARYEIKFSNCTIIESGMDSPGANGATLMQECQEADLEAAAEILPGQNAIELHLDREIHLPETVAAKEVKVSFELRDPDGTVSDFGSGEAISVEILRPDNREGFTRALIFAKTEKEGKAVPIPVGAEVTVVIGEKAGIKNPYRGGTFLWEVGTTKGMAPVQARHPDPEVRAAFERVESAAGDHAVPHQEVGLLVDWEVRLEPDEARREEMVTAIGRGYGVRSAVTFWRDANFDGIYDEETESTLCRVTSNDQGVAECSFQVTSPPFAPGFGDCPIDRVIDMGTSTYDDSRRDCNFINAADGHGHSSIFVFDEQRVTDNSLTDAFQVLRLRGTVEVSNFSRPHRDVSFELFDFPPGAELLDITVGGFSLDSEVLSGLRVPALGRMSIAASLPGRLQPGEQRIRVIYLPPNGDPSAPHDSGDHDSERLLEEYTDATLDNSLLVQGSPQSISPNQEFRLSVRGFIGSNIRRITLAGVALDIGSVFSYREDGFQVDSSGRWAGSFVMPINRATIQGGERRLVVQDDEGTEGELTLTLPERVLEVTPVEALPGETIKVEGTGFPVRNSGGVPVPLAVSYRHAMGEVSTTIEPDSSGNFSAELTIPLSTGIPSSNRVVVEFRDDEGNRVETSADHQVPEANITLAPPSGPPGTTIRLTGTGFRRFVPVNSVSIDGLDVTPSPAPATDRTGKFETEFLVPQLETGMKTVVVSAGGVIVTGDLAVGSATVETGPAYPIQEALADLGDRLVVCFHFRNDAKTWEFYEPGFPEDSTLTDLVMGEIYWIQVEEDTSAILNGKRRNLTCGGENCWNLITW